MTSFTVTPAELLQAATDCTNANSQIQGQVQQVLTFINSLRDSGYKGPCSDQLLAVADQWYTDASKLNTVLTEIASNLTTNANNYGGSEAQNTTNLIPFAAGLGGGNF